MIMLISTIILMLITFIFTTGFNARYCFQFLARRFYTADELSHEFSTMFASQLRNCTLPIKRLISSKNMGIWQGPDTRPIIYAAGAIYINEEMCKQLSLEMFGAGLAYEQAHHDSGFYMYSEAALCAIFIGCMPLVTILHNISQALLLSNTSGLIAAFAYVINIFQEWSLLQFIIIWLSMILVEFALGKSVVNFYARQGYDLPNLLLYLRFMENYITPGLNQTFNISSNRSEVNKLLMQENQN